IGGIFSEHRSRAIFLTLALPVKRNSWVLGQAGIAWIGVLLLNAMGALIVTSGGFLAGHTLAPTQALAGLLLNSVAAAPYIAFAVLASAYTGDRAIAGATAILFVAITNKLD